MYSFFFFFNDTATTEIYTLSLHDALPIWRCRADVSRHAIVGDVLRRDARRRRVAEEGRRARRDSRAAANGDARGHARRDRKSTRLNSSHLVISYAVFCL